MKQPPSDGKCELCGETFKKSTMTTHLQRKCLPGHDAAKGKLQKLIQLVADGDGPYWLHVEMPGKAKFAHLDRFLRRIWLECCGHMSAFEFHRDIMRRLDLDFDSPIDLEYPEDALMDYPVQEILEPKLAFNYDYDFGSTTTLHLRVTGIRDGVWSGKDKVRLLARNLPPPRWSVPSAASQPSGLTARAVRRSAFLAPRRRMLSGTCCLSSIRRAWECAPIRGKADGDHSSRGGSARGADDTELPGAAGEQIVVL